MSEKRKHRPQYSGSRDERGRKNRNSSSSLIKRARRESSGPPVLKKAYRVFAIIVTLYHLVFASGLYMPETLKHRSIHVGMILILAFMLYPATKKASRKVIAWYDYVFIASSAAVPSICA